MIVKYTGPHERLQQVGRVPIDVKRGQATELPDDLAERMLKCAPQHWSKVEPKATPADKTKSAPAATPAEGSES